jgi:Flp pilus assembly pilin Flp
MSWLKTARSIPRQVLRDNGQDLLEYALLGGLIAITAIAGVSKLGATLNSTFWEVIGNYNYR